MQDTIQTSAATRASAPHLQNSSPARKVQIWTAIAVIELLLLGAVLCVLAWKQSVDWDEALYVSTGVSYVQKGDYRFNIEHPPLFKLMAGAGAVLAGGSGDYSSADWTQTRETEWVNGFFQKQADAGKLTRVLFGARVPMILMTLALGLTIFLWARQLAGPVAGVVCLSLFAGYPLFLAWGCLVLNDVQVALFSILTCWAAVALWNNPGRRSAMWFGLAFGAALVSKFSALLLGPILVCTFALLSIGWYTGLVNGPRAAAPTRREHLKRTARALGFGFAIAIVFVYGTYSYAARHFTPYDYMQSSRHEWGKLDAHNSADDVKQNEEVMNFFGRHPYFGRAVAPMFYYAGGNFVCDTNLRRPSWLLGKLYPTGQWFYFPVVTLYKSPYGFLALVSAGWVALLYGWRRHLRNPGMIVLVVLFAAFTAAYLRSGPNIGQRHVITCIACGILLAAMLVPEIARAGRSFRLLASALCVAALLQIGITAVRAYPFYLSYFNSLRGQHERVWVASDANVDHGIYLPWVRQEIAARGLDHPALVPFSQQAQLWIPGATEWKCEQGKPATRWMVVSSALLYGTPKIGDCSWVSQYPHTEVVGGSTMIVDLGER